jgi:2-dehydropantoate 2-reductase
MNSSQHSLKNPQHSMTFLCLGAGAIGTYIGGSLAANGHKVVFLEQPGIVSAIRESGLTINSNAGIIRVNKPQVVSSIPEALSLGPFDVGLIALKSFDTESVIQEFIPFLNQTPPILCLQNGVENEPLIEKLLGKGKVIPGTITSSITRNKPGEITIEKIRGAGIVDGYPLSTALLNAFAVSNLRPILFYDAARMKWSKLLTNLLSNAASAILDWPPDQVFAHPGLSEMEREQLRETLRVMKTQGIKPINLPKTPVKLLAYTVEHLPLQLSRWFLRRAVGSGRGQKMPSFHIDLYHGRGKSEVDFLNGAVVRFGKRFGIETPVNAGLNSILIALTEGKIPLDSYLHNPTKLLDAINQKQKIH